ncbi:MAG: hypothetical protein ACTSUE_18440 [Promethearchaeota archaeon]
MNSSKNQPSRIISRGSAMIASSFIIVIMAIALLQDDIDRFIMTVSMNSVNLTLLGVAIFAGTIVGILLYGVISNLLLMTVLSTLVFLVAVVENVVASLMYINIMVCFGLIIAVNFTFLSYFGGHSMKAGLLTILSFLFGSFFPKIFPLINWLVYCTFMMVGTIYLIARLIMGVKRGASPAMLRHKKSTILFYNGIFRSGPVLGRGIILLVLYAGSEFFQSNYIFYNEIGAIFTFYLFFSISMLAYAMVRVIARFKRIMYRFIGYLLIYSMIPLLSWFFIVPLLRVQFNREILYAVTILLVLLLFFLGVISYFALAFPRGSAQAFTILDNKLENNKSRVNIPR